MQTQLTWPLAFTGLLVISINAEQLPQRAPAARPAKTKPTSASSTGLIRHEGHVNLQLAAAWYWPAARVPCDPAPPPLKNRLRLRAD